MRPSMAVLVLVAWPAAVSAAEMRPGQAEVLQPPAKVAPPELQVPAEFRAHYLAAGRPRLMLLWNRSLTDELERATERVDVLQVDSAPGHAQLRHSTREGPVDATPRTTLSARDAALLEAAFTEELLASEVRLVDRTTSIRSAHARDRKEENSQLVEADAIRTMADLLMEVRFVPHRSNPLGHAFTVAIKRFSTGETLGLRYTDAKPPAAAPTGRYVASDDGYRWRADPAEPVDARQLGRHLARESLVTLDKVLGGQRQP